MPPTIPSVTVLMPVHNAGDYLTDAVESILAQTHSDFEFVIIDDGSTDRSGAILQSFAARDSRIRLVATAQQGIARALNRGLAEAHADIVARMDADDIARPERIERQLAFFAANPDVVAAGSAMQLVDGNRKAIRVQRYSLTHAAVVDSLNRGNSPMGHPTMAMRRVAVLAIGGYRPQFNHGEDFDLLLRLAERHQLANLPDILLDYRCHGQNLSLRRRYEQALAAQIAKLAAQERRRGRADPTDGLDRLTLADIGRFALPPHERDAILLDLSEAGLTAYKATAEARYLAAVEQSLFAHRYRDPPRARRIARPLVRHWLTQRRPGRAAAVIGWAARSEFAAGIGLDQRLQGWKQDHQHRAWRNLALDWMMHCADPLAPRTPVPAAALSAEAADLLIEQAAAHGVLSAMLRNCPQLSADPALAPAHANAVARHREILSMALMLQQQADALMEAANGLPVAIVKGPVFARTIYPGIGSRPFTDIDLLVAPEAKPALSTILAAHGFAPTADDDDPAETQWLHGDNHALMIEVHTDLVHADSLRHAMSLTYADIAGQPEAPATQLIVAIIHGSLGGHFEQLRNLADICQAARALTAAADERQFLSLVARTGAHLAAQTGLVLAGRCFAEPRCFAIAAALGPARYGRLARWLIDRSVVRSTKTADRWHHAWRRQAFRQLLKWSNRRAPAV